MRVYASELLAESTLPADAETARNRVVRKIMGTAATCGTAISPLLARAHGEEGAGYDPRALQWMDAYWANVVAAIDSSVTSRRLDEVAATVPRLIRYVTMRRRASEWLPAIEAAAEAARNTNQSLFIGFEELAVDALKDLRLYEACLQRIDRLLPIVPDTAFARLGSIHNIRGTALQELYRHDEALAAFSQSIQPVDARQVVVRVRVRRLRCNREGCGRTFREQLPGVLVRYQRRTPRLASQIGAVARELAGRAGARALSALAVFTSRHTALRTLLRLPLPVRPVPRVLGVDDFALRKRCRYATVLIDAQTRERIDVLPDRSADTLEAWLRSHPGVEVVCRDGSGAYAEAIRRALPDAVQVGDRWHIWHNLGKAVVTEVAAHSACWGKASLRSQDGKRDQTTRQRWHQVHDLLEKGVGLLECARRLNLALNTVKRYARVAEPERLQRVPQYRPTLVDPFREHLKRRRAQDPAVAVLRLFEEIKALGYKGSFNLLYRYITQGRVEGDRPPISPRRLARLLLTRPSSLTDKQRDLRDDLTAACPEMIDLAAFVRDFADLLRPREGNAERLDQWVSAVRDADLPHLQAFTRGLDQDREAVHAALTLPYHNGGTEGVNTKTKRIMRQMHGRAGFALLRHRILLS
ncbi:ISL3 family transposase [Allorhizocola rhizosphaerae]|uniref:ISL3 family transposase n=1 Tax=Allorhizocola rhizosphaerae TaxID=1872709 RepID=UPI00319E9F14